MLSGSKAGRGQELLRSIDIQNGATTTLRSVSTLPTSASRVPVSSGYADMNGIELYYEMYGQGEPLVLLHGGLDGDRRNVHADRARVPTLLNAESRGIHGKVCFRGSHWQGELKRRAAPTVAVGPNSAALRFDDRLTDCQAHAAALWLRRKERLEYLVGLAQG